jgi:predicted enzyme related to lactoylglutathione lyase
VWGMRLPLRLIEFPADDLERARRFWSGVLGVDLLDRTPAAGQGSRTAGGVPALGIHQRGTGPGDSYSLPYFEVDDLGAALLSVRELGGEVIHRALNGRSAAIRRGARSGSPRPAGKRRA